MFLHASWGFLGLVGISLTVFCPGVTGQARRRRNQDCVESEGLFLDPDATNCGGFLQCSASKFVAQPCPSGLMFNEDSQICDWPSQVLCQGRRDVRRGFFSQNSYWANIERSSNRQTQQPRRRPQPVWQQSMPKSMQQPYQQNTQQPIQQMVQQPMQQPMQQLMQQPMQQSMQQPMQQPMQQSIRQPMQQSMQQPMQQQMMQPMQMTQQKQPFSMNTQSQNLNMLNTGLLGGTGFNTMGLMKGGVGMEMSVGNNFMGVGSNQGLNIGNSMMGSEVTLFPPFLSVLKKKRNNFNMMGMNPNTMNMGMMNNGMMNNGMMNMMGMMNGNNKNPKRPISPIIIPYPFPPAWFAGMETTASPDSTTADTTTSSTTTGKKQGSNIFFISMVPPMLPFQGTPPCALTTGSDCPGVPLCNETNVPGCLDVNVLRIHRALFGNTNSIRSFQPWSSITGGAAGGSPGSLFNPSNRGRLNQGQGQRQGCTPNAQRALDLSNLINEGSSNRWTRQECEALQGLLNSVISTQADARAARDQRANVCPVNVDLRCA